MEDRKEDDDLHQPNDKLFAATFGIPENAAALLREQLPAPVVAAIDWDGMRLSPGTFVDSHYRRSHTDLLFTVPIRETGRNGYVYILFEHQSSPDRMLPLRILRYLVRIWEKEAANQPPGNLLPVILPVVLSQNAEPWDLPERLRPLLDLPYGLEDALRPFIPDFGYRHIQLGAMDFHEIPGTPAGRLILRAMKAERLGRLLDEVVWDESLILLVPREVFQRLLRFVLGSDIDRGDFENRLGEIRDPELRNTAMTLAQRYRQDGLQQGLELGRQEGRQEGKQEGKHEGLLAARRDDLLEALTIRFGEVPADIRALIEGERDEMRLRRLLREAIRGESLESFRREL